MNNLPQIIHIPKFEDERGNLSFIEQELHIPFVIKRTFWIYDVPGGVERGNHAYQDTEEFIVALSGSFDIILSNGITKMKYSLNRSYCGLYIPVGWWRVINNFSTNSVALVHASTYYNADKYITDYDKFSASPSAK